MQGEQCMQLVLQARLRTITSFAVTYNYVCTCMLASILRINFMYGQYPYDKHINPTSLCFLASNKLEQLLCIQPGITDAQLHTAV